ncbi:MAG: helix-turn-helix domain-containing protein [Thaumarchaeota archaeon]|jgi:adenine/guanine phosphoribosyltransferase-like PRPP-binding protein|nr:helix-turn-helix domain-containing protein [Candidatus Terraquivivens yellowstonensis]
MVKTYVKSTPLMHGMETVALDLLKLLKQKYDYKTLSKMTGLPTSTLNRYIKNKTVPRNQNVKKLIEKVAPIIDMAEIIREKALISDEDVNVYELVSNPSMLKLINFFIMNEFSGSKLTAIMPLDVHSIPLSAVSAITVDRRILLLSERPLWDDEEAITLTYKIPGFVEKFKLWLPKNVVSSKDSVLMISSFLNSDSLVNSAVSMLQKRGASVTGLFSIMAKEQLWKKVLLPPGSKKKCLLLV